jgi:hypothetical protein
MAGLGMTYQQLQKYLMEQMGYPKIQVHLTSDQYVNCINNCLKLYGRNRPVIRYQSVFAQPVAGDDGIFDPSGPPTPPGTVTTVPATTPQFQLSNTSQYNQGIPIDPSTIGYGILSASPQFQNALIPLMSADNPDRDLFAFRLGYNPYYDIASLEYDFAYYDMVNRVLSSEYEWEYLDGQLFIYPPLDQGTYISVCCAVPPELGDENSGTISTFKFSDEDWLQDAAMAQVKMLEGRILRRYNVIPGATAPLTLDGPELVREGKEEWEDAKKTLNARVPHIPMFFGTSNYHVTPQYNSGLSQT